MGTSFESVTTRLEETVLHFFSPDGLLTVVVLVVLSVMLFSGSSIERRTMESPASDHFSTTVSPILDTTR